MTLRTADRVLETTTTTGTGALSLGGAVTGFQAFSSVCSNGDTCYYALQQVNSNGVPTGAWEVGLGTYATSGDTLTRTTILASSNSGSVVSLPVGTTQVWLDTPASAIASLLAGQVGAFQALSAGGNDALLYSNSSTTSIANGTVTTLTGWTKVFDRLGTNFNASTGTFTAPVSGYYQVSAQCLWASAAGVVGTGLDIYVTVNGTATLIGAILSQSTSTMQQVCSVNGAVFLTAGQTIVIQVSQSSGVARALAGGATYTYVSIMQIP